MTATAMSDLAPTAPASPGAYVRVTSRAPAYANGHRMTAWVSVVPPGEARCRLRVSLRTGPHVWHFAGINRAVYGAERVWGELAPGAPLMDEPVADLTLREGMLPRGQYTLLAKALDDDGNVIGSGKTAFLIGDSREVCDILAGAVDGLRHDLAERIGDPDLVLDESNSVLVDAGQVHVSLVAAFPGCDPRAFRMADRSYRCMTLATFRYLMLMSGIRRQKYIPESRDCDDFARRQSGLFPDHAAASDIWGQRTDGTGAHALCVAVTDRKWAGGGYQRVYLGEPQTGQVTSTSALDHTHARWLPTICMF